MKYVSINLLLLCLAVGSALAAIQADPLSQKPSTHNDNRAGAVISRQIAGTTTSRSIETHKVPWSVGEVAQARQARELSALAIDERSGTISEDVAGPGSGLSTLSGTSDSSAAQ